MISCWYFCAYSHPTCGEKKQSVSPSGARGHLTASELCCGECIDALLLQFVPESPAALGVLVPAPVGLVQELDLFLVAILLMVQLLAVLPVRLHRVRDGDIDVVDRVARRQKERVGGAFPQLAGHEPVFPA